MKKVFTVVVESAVEEDIREFGKSLSLFLEEWDEEVVSYDGGKIIE